MEQATRPWITPHSRLSVPYIARLSSAPHGRLPAKLHITPRSSESKAASTSEDGNGAEHNGKPKQDWIRSSDPPAQPLSPPQKQGNTGEKELQRETFAGRVAILTLGAILLGERLTGRGIVATMKHNTGIPLWEMQPLLAIGVLFLLIVALYPSRTPLLQPSTQGRDIWYGAQRLVGRCACLLLAGTIVTEVVTGKGALALFNIETGKETLDEVEIIVAFLVLLFLTANPKDVEA